MLRRRLSTAIPTLWAALIDNLAAFNSATVKPRPARTIYRQQLEGKDNGWVDYGHGGNGNCIMSVLSTLTLLLHWQLSCRYQMKQ
jgi:hypothetical protein